MDADCHNAWRFKGPQHRDWKGHGRRPTSSSVLPGCAPASYLSTTPIPLPPTGLSCSLSSKRKSSPNISHKRTSLVKNTGGIFSVHAANSNPPSRGQERVLAVSQAGRGSSPRRCSEQSERYVPRLALRSCASFVRHFHKKIRIEEPHKNAPI